MLLDDARHRVREIGRERLLRFRGRDANPRIEGERRHRLSRPLGACSQVGEVVDDP
jgi:hypothetical protein